mmetsp:Transcript_9532/g.14086  ORF Transcript_9532/g.14086 Transcript_9532/m.14086 type:complete len:129 (-) Transcript_9532:3-389(-)
MSYVDSQGNPTSDNGASSSYALTLEDNKDTYLCACGLSQKLPLCDGSHAKKNTPFKPVRVNKSSSGLLVRPMEELRQLAKKKESASSSSCSDPYQKNMSLLTSFLFIAAYSFPTTRRWISKFTFSASN